MNRLSSALCSNEQRTNVHEVIETLDATGLEKSTTLLLGGGVLAACGIRPTRDVDIMVPEVVYQELQADYQTPSGLRVVPKPGAHHPFLQTPPDRLPTGILPIDITYPHNPDDIYRTQLDDLFMQSIQHYETIEGYPYLPLNLVAEHKRRTGPYLKNRHDQRLIRQHLKQSV